LRPAARADPVGLGQPCPGLRVPLWRRITRSRVALTAASRLCATSPCASASVARDRPASPKQSAGAGTAGGPVMTGPRSEPSGSAAGTSPEVFVPFSADQPRRALAPGRQPAIRTVPLRHLAFAGPAPDANLRPAYAVPLRVSAVSEIGSGIARLMDDCRGGSFDRRQRAACCNRVCSTTTGHAFVDREDAIPVVIDASRQVRSG